MILQTDAASSGNAASVLNRQGRLSHQNNENCPACGYALFASQSYASGLLTGPAAERAVVHRRLTNVAPEFSRGTIACSRDGTAATTDRRDRGASEAQAMTIGTHQSECAVSATRDDPSGSVWGGERRTGPICRSVGGQDLESSRPTCARRVDCAEMHVIVVLQAASRDRRRYA